LDAHIHLTDDRVWGLASQWLEEARSAGIRGWVLAGTHPAEWARQLEFKAHTSADGFVVKTSCGLHPYWVRAGEIDRMLERLQAEAQRFDAIGETGLHAEGARPVANIAAQERVFRAHLELAKELEKPLILHVVREHARALALLEHMGFATAIGQGAPLRGMVHSFSGSIPSLDQYLRAGWLISISGGGGLLHPSAKRREVLRAIPRDRLLVETDAPDQALAPGASGGNRPSALLRVAEALGRARGFGETGRSLLEDSRRNLAKLWPDLL